MNKKRYAVPALVLGMALLGGTTAAYAAFTPGAVPSDVLAGFSTDQQAAIQKAQDIRTTAETQSKAVLDAAGVSENALHKAMGAYHQKHRTALDAALDANDYEAFKGLVAGTPMASSLTPDVFAKLVKIHSLEKSGDRAGAQALRKELGATGFGFGPGGKGGMMHDASPRPMMP